MRSWFMVSTLALAGAHAQQSVVLNIPPVCSTLCTVLGSLGGTDPSTLCTKGVRGDLQGCLNCILMIGGKAITPNLMTSGQRAANAFASACGNASFKVDPIFVQSPVNPANPAPTVLSEPTPSGNKNGASLVAACGVSGLAFVWSVTMLLL